MFSGFFRFFFNEDEVVVRVISEGFESEFGSDLSECPGGVASDFNGLVVFEGGCEWFDGSGVTNEAEGAGGGCADAGVVVDELVCNGLGCGGVTDFAEGFDGRDL